MRCELSRRNRVSLRLRRAGAFCERFELENDGAQMTNEEAHMRAACLFIIRSFWLDSSRHSDSFIPGMRRKSAQDG
jgi:hypothetical protein